jgi:hypothetical protein
VNFSFTSTPPWGNTECSGCFLQSGYFMHLQTLAAINTHHVQPPWDLSWFALAALTLSLIRMPNMTFGVSRTLFQGCPAVFSSPLEVLSAYSIQIATIAIDLNALLLASLYVLGSTWYTRVTNLLLLARRKLHPATAAPFTLQRLRPAPHLALVLRAF